MCRNSSWSLVVLCYFISLACDLLTQRQLWLTLKRVMLVLHCAAMTKADLQVWAAAKVLAVHLLLGVTSYQHLAVPLHFIAHQVSPTKPTCAQSMHTAVLLSSLQAP